MRRTVTALVVSGLGLAGVGCGASESGDDPAGLVPRETSIYAEVVLDPEGEQEDAVNSLVARFPGGEAGPGDLIKRALESASDEFSYERHVESWIGDRAVGFLTGLRGGTPQGGAVIATEDAGEAENVLEEVARENDAPKRSHEDVDYWLSDGAALGLVEDHVVVATEPGFKQVVDTAGGDSFEEQDSYQDAIADLPDDRLATVYFDFRRLLSGTGLPAAEAQPLLRLYEEPFTIAVSAEDDAIVVDSGVAGELAASTAPFLSAGSEMVEELPAGSWFALGQGDVGKQFIDSFQLFAGVPGAGRDQIERELRRATGLGADELFGWMGDLGLFARGRDLSDLGVGLVIETSDPAASRRAIDVLRRAASSEGVQVGPPTLPGGGAGFTARIPGAPGPVHVTQRGERVVAALGDDAASEALAPERALGEDPGFTDAVEALGADYLVSTYLQFAPILAFAENLGAAQDAGYRMAKPYLRPFDRFIAGAKDPSGEGEELISRLRLELR